MSSAVSTVLDAGARGESIPVRLSNAYCVALASADQDYRALLNAGGINFPDGTPVVWVMRAKLRKGYGALRAGRVRGPTFFTEVLRATPAAGLSNYFLGTTSTTLEKLERALTVKIPELRIAGKHAPAFGPLNEDFYDRACEEILQSGADLVWVALGTPKQDFVATELARRTGVPCIGVGAAFDFVAGTVREAPVWVQSTGLEWLYRLCSEPRRLWRRYLFGNFRFLYSVLAESRN
ncbi:N-acetylglucosaminyldiphosphoundecaprenol N-acetyl-beta-D-mannosaminyltransferase [Williamsia limnetica]|uniref:N-acetylglucosaminyldiphosphoundecaprenol N-acetyl-beta-D-mannosaminyltransferase n=1 Tax=Williamsia limnetica TaxID=882452 RepID=A0A318RS02_WILLI|nr:WecB/TagA/CpsF family glycosyltransferase [Williamsia limnetica]PYE20198.1 N-acetylglucosaminyldiphosphoundecaprenol N-acetyl-beta-D-mannosaminyltransferase [Williamsia limnetica]